MDRAGRRGLRGLYIDDVTMTRRVYQPGHVATARDPRTGLSLTEANWQRYMADFMVAVRAAFPTAEIVHDVLWQRGDAGAEIARELAAASSIALEKGFNDPAVIAGSGTSGFWTFVAFVERRQAAGQGVILDAPADTSDGLTYGLAPPPPDSTVPVATATPTPSPRRPRRRAGNPTATIAGAAEPGNTSVSVTVSRLGVSGRVKGAVSGYVHVTVQRQRGKRWVTVRRAKPSIAKRGRFEGAIARLARGTYRVTARFEGTGTAEPSRSRYRTRRL